MGLADFIHHCCTVHGIAEFELACHQVTQKMYPVTSHQVVSCAEKLLKQLTQSSILEVSGDSQEPLPVPYRYVVSPARSGKCQVFKPNALARADAVRLVFLWPRVMAMGFLSRCVSFPRHNSFGASWVGHMDKLPKGVEQGVGVVWDV